MKRIVLAFAFVLSLLAADSMAAVGAGVHRGKITNVYTNGNGNIAFNIINLDGTTSTTIHQLWVPGTDTGSRNMLAVLLAAWQNGTTVTFTAAAWANSGGLERILDLWITQ